jgi:hypothetical protein
MIIRELAARLGLDIDQSAFQAADAALGAVKGGLIAIGVFAGAAVVGLAGAVAKTAEYADQIDKAAQRTGIGVESLQALRYAAERADVGMEGLQGALNFMAKRGVKDFEAEFRRAADELARMPAGGARAKRAIELFGRQGAMLLPMLSEGSAGLDEMTRMAREMGLVLSEDGITAGKDLKDAIEELQGSLRGVAYTIAGPLLKPAREWLTRLGEWIRANRVLLAQRFTNAVEGLGKALSVAYRLVEPLVDMLGRLLDSSTAVAFALAALGVVVALPWAAPAAALLFFLGLLEEVWGWMTGKRKTLLEDMFGPWADIEKSFRANPIVQSLEGWKKALEDVLGTIRAIKAELGMGGKSGSDQYGADAEAMKRGFAAAGVTGMASQWELAKDPRFSELARAGDFDGIMREFGPGGLRAPTPEALPWAADMMRLDGALAPATGPTVTFPGMTIHAGAGADGGAIANDFMDQVEQRFDLLWTRNIAAAAPAGAR